MKLVSQGPYGMPLRVSVFGLGYVGLVMAASLASRGNQVIGVDPNAGAEVVVVASHSIDEGALNRLLSPEQIVFDSVGAAMRPGFSLAPSPIFSRS